MVRNTRQFSRGFWVTLFVASAGLGGAAGAEDNPNILDRTGAPSENRLMIDQSADGGHTARLHLGAEQAVLPGANWARRTPSLLEPGRIAQTGSAHILTASITGEANQLAVLQTGQAHRATILSDGTANMVSIAQTGHGNSAGVSQAGTRNSVVMIQN
ncbi:hypothetical protein [Roseovarius sp. SYSU LYC5161]|uniref:hypothetical protein n=1 Tax=Roseovarius halophilus (ex Wu et al. 2025) TaxID=3376060 RepID=UPI002871354C|nr:hypothetical protein [Roseovarius sp.]